MYKYSNPRRGKRYRFMGLAQLISDTHAISAQVIDISTTGISLRLPPEFDAAIAHHDDWVCRIKPKSAPAPIEFRVRPTRKQSKAHGFVLGCTISAIDDAHMALLNEIYPAAPQE